VSQVPFIFVPLFYRNSKIIIVLEECVDPSIFCIPFHIVGPDVNFPRKHLGFTPVNNEYDRHHEEDKWTNCVHKSINEGKHHEVEQSKEFWISNIEFLPAKNETDLVLKPNQWDSYIF